MASHAFTLYVDSKSQNAYVIQSWSRRFSAILVSGTMKQFAIAVSGILARTWNPEIERFFTIDDTTEYVANVESLRIVGPLSSQYCDVYWKMKRQGLQDALCRSWKYTDAVAGKCVDRTFEVVAPGPKITDAVTPTKRKKKPVSSL